MKRVSLLGWVAAALLATAVAPIATFGEHAAVHAQDTAETAAEERATAFRGVEGAETDSVPGGTLLLVAYAIVWLMIFGFFWRLRRLHQRNADELARLAGKVHGASSSD